MDELNPRIMGLINNLNTTTTYLQDLGTLLLNQESKSDWLEHISHPIAIVKPNTTEFVYVNHSFRAILQVPKENKKSLHKLTEYIDVGLFQEIKNKIKTTENINVYKVKFNDIEGNEKLFNLVIKLFNKDNEQLIIIIFHEVQTLKLAKFAGEISKLSTLLSNLPGVAYHCRNDRKWTMEFISEECLYLTGYYPSELIDNKEYCYNDIIHPLDRNFVWEEVQKALKNYQNYTLEYRIITRSGKEKWVFEKGRGIYHPSGEVLFLEGFILDISDKKKIEQEKNLLLTLTQEITQASDFNTALLITLEKVCQYTNWDFGEAWQPDKNNTKLEYITGWFSPEKNQINSDSLSLEEFREKSYQFTFYKSIGLPGKTWELNKSYWLENVSVEALFLRNKLALECGLKAGFGVPIICDEEVVTILVFFMRESRSEDKTMIALIESLACQLSNIFYQKKMQVELKESQRQLDSLIDATSGLFFRISYSPDWLTNYISNGCENLTGYAKDELINNETLNLAAITHPLDLERIITVIQKSIEKKINYIIEYRIFTKDNKQKWVWEKGHGVFNNDGELLGIEGFITDISERKKIEILLAESEKKYQNIFENAIEGIFQTTIDGHYLSANLALAKIYGYDSPQELKQRLTDIENQLYVKPETRKEFINLLQKNDFVSGFECQVIRKDGQIIWISENARVVKDYNGKPLYFEGTVEDITKYKEAKEKLHKQAFYDPLTDLPNRAFFLQKLEEVIEYYQNNYDSSAEFALLFLDCDRFKVVNDSLGHFIGDELLIAIAKRLLKCVRDKDIVARLGGDEFTILLNNISDIKQVVKVAERIKDECTLPFYLKGHKIFSGMSIGILYSGSLNKNEFQLMQPAILLQNADTALYQAKAKGKGCYQFFQSEMHNEALAELELENHLRHALERKELIVYYQPILCTKNRKIKGFEALIRWQHPTKGFISPSQFIPIAEETGLIISIGNWILEQVCLQINEWQKILKQQKTDILEPIIVSVNLSYRQFCDHQLINNIDSILEKTKIPTESLKLEITESYCMIDEQKTITKMEQLKARNIGLWIDDFGTGYSSFSYLHKLPIQGLKIDSSFVSEIDKNPVKEKIAKAIFALAQDLDLKVISEGIETEKQLEKLQLAGNILGQGYLFSQPLNAKEATLFLLENI